jgi:branched-chain amino acid transport system ATP-binding protein
VALEVQGVTVRFGGHTALDAVTLDAPDGLVTGLIGPNGAGKTTLFNVVTGVQRPQSGSVRLHGRSLDGVPAHQRARQGLGRTFQRLELFGSLSVRDNIRVATTSLPRASRAARTQELLERVGLERVAEQQADTVSTGTGRLIELARCLATAPQVVLLDEPASGQDEQETERFAALLTELASDGIAILLVEHDMDLVMRVCQRLHVLDFGHLIASGTPDEVRVDDRVQAAYLGAEATT